MEELLSTLSGFGSSKMEDIGFLPFFLLMLVSLCSSFFISFLYTVFYSVRATGSQVHRAFPLIGLSITTIFISIQFSLPLSLGLLGALSIVRFRTPIKEPEEVGFIMLVIAASLCCATFNLIFLAIFLSVAVVALLAAKFLTRVLKVSMNDGVIIVSLPASEFEKNGDVMLKILKEKIPNGRVDSITDDKDEYIISFNFIKLNQDYFFQLQEELKKIGSVRVNLFYNKQGAV